MCAREWSILNNILHHRYVLSSRAARVLVDYIDRVGFARPADHLLFRLMELTDTPYTTIPHIVRLPESAVNNMHNTADTDIQHTAQYIDGGPFTPGRGEWVSANPDKFRKQ